MVKNRRYTLAEQIYTLKGMYKGSRSTQLSPSSFCWFMDVQPLPLSDTYTLKILYAASMTWPKVFITKPFPLKLADGATVLPHCYDTKKQQLCLFYPKYREWDDTMLIAKTIVHWAIMWIIYYETWVISGKWLGGGHGDWDAPKSATTNHDD